LDLCLISGQVEAMPAGSYRYRSATHNLTQVATGDLRSDLGRTALNQTWIAGAPAAIVITGAYERSSWKYGPGRDRYVHMEAGHAGQNLAPQAVALELGCTPVGAFDDRALQRLLRLSSDEQPLAIFPVGDLH
jgi:SagB-type dehydrogenase family enzyme